MAEKIVRDGTGRLFRALERWDDNLIHCWLAYPVKRTTDGYVPTKERVRLLRKVGCTVIEETVL